MGGRGLKPPETPPGYDTVSDNVSRVAACTLSHSCPTYQIVVLMHHACRSRSSMCMRLRWEESVSNSEGPRIIVGLHKNIHMLRHRNNYGHTFVLFHTSLSSINSVSDRTILRSYTVLKYLLVSHSSVYGKTKRIDLRV